MKISYNWLNDFLKTDLSIEKLADLLTDIGLEVEGLTATGVKKEDLNGFVVGKVVSCEKHPNADKLSLTQVDIGSGELQQIVCGAPNITEGLTVPVATIGTVIKDDKGNQFTVKKAKLRGESSNGMICSKKELRIGNDESGIWEMDDEFSAGQLLSDVIETNSDTLIEIGLTPNRADAMSHLGVARDAYAAMKARKIKAEFFAPKTQDFPISKNVNPINIEVKDTDLCPRFTGVYIKDVQVKDSPNWLQDRLKTIGITPKNNIVDATNYILHSLGQPLHAYDSDKLSGNKIIVDSAKGNEKIETLDNETREINKKELLIYDAEKPIGIAGVMGGLETSVSNSTKNIFIESAYFNSISVRKTAKAHGINSDSSFRFERGIDPNFTLKALKIATDLIMKIAGGEIIGDFEDLYSNKIKDFDIVLKISKLNNLTGIRFHKERIKEILELLEIDVISEGTDFIEVKVPPYRVDVQREVDLTEEIMRIHGFNNINSNEKLSTSIVSGEGYKTDKIENSLADMLVSQGFFEAMNISIYNPIYDEWLNYNDGKSIPLANALSSDLSSMRRSLLPGLLENTDYNIKRKAESIKLFEFGNTYTKNENTYKEQKTLALALSGNMFSQHWKIKNRKVSLNDLKGQIEQLFKRLKISNLVARPNDDSNYNNALDLIYNNQVLATLGKVSNKLTKKFDIDQEVFYAEINVQKLLNLYNSYDTLMVSKAPKFPSVKRDLALLIDKKTSYQEIRDLILESNNKIIDVNLFDVYEGDKLPDNKKSYAISINMQDLEKTMIDKEIDKIMNKIINQLKNNLKAELRK